MKQDIIDFLKNKKILILGYGREGKSALSFLQQNLPDAIFAVADQNPIEIDGVDAICGENYLDAVKDYDVVIKSPGIPTRDFVNADQLSKITSLTDLFLRFCPNTIIGVTGTKGKSTTTSLTHHILKTAGRDALLVGNIGKPCFDTIDLIHDDTIIVFELSCHQLEFVHKSPHIAILLNLYEEHFDHYQKTTPLSMATSSNMQAEQNSSIYRCIK